MGVRGSVRGSIAALVLAAACATEYNRPPGTRSGPPSSGGSAGMATGGSGGFPVVPRAGSTSTGGRAPSEPPGEDVLTLVNGVVDAKSVLFCLTSGSGASSTAIGSPFPEGGLAYGESLVLREIPELELATEPLAPVLIAGDLELVEGMDCEEALATARSEQAAAPSSGAGGAGGEPLDGAAGSANEPGEPDTDETEASAGAGFGGAGGAPVALPPPPRLRAAVLPMVPAGTLSTGKSTLLVSMGCIGGPAFVSPQDELACGEEYSGARPSLSAVLVRMSRRRAVGRLGLQVLHASVATGELDLRAAPLTQKSELPFSIATRVGYGVIAPDPPRLDFPASSYGAATSGWGVELMVGGSVLYSESWDDLLGRTGITLADGRNYTLVVVGAGVGLPERYFWNAARVVVVDNDPTTVE
jgi:hypothetical protein